MIPKVKLGRTPLEVSRLCLGAMYFGSKDSDGESLKRLDQYAAAGGNFLDTANMYAHWATNSSRGGESERLIGDWLRRRSNRSQMVVATKVGFPYPGVTYGTTAKQIKEECDKSLLRLGTDYIDLYYAHTDDLQTPMEETLEAFNDLVRAGKVRYIGASNFSAWRLERAKQISERNGWASYCCIQQRFTYARPKTGWDFGGQISANDDLLQYVKDAGISLLAYSPLLGGSYTNSSKPFMEQYQGPDTDARLKVLREIADETGATCNQLVYFWLMHAAASIPLVASSTDEQFAEALGTLRMTLSDEQVNRLSAAGI
ncbi:MAG: aldo/keto reductase [Paenibacillaceae bacterium]|nr:aldo/keto reductase [Paenibacillaceae bacterium]